MIIKHILKHISIALMLFSFGTFVHVCLPQLREAAAEVQAWIDAHPDPARIGGNLPPAPQIPKF
ncbi:MAG: hypothetical protein M0Z99_34825 [Betaproteobacteria bacterium]|nr:hypothetical protein [Betaproteobacteria bacterium]